MGSKKGISKFLLLLCGGASVPRYDSAFHLGMFDVRAKHFRQDTVNLKNLTLCNPKNRLFLYLLGECFAPTSLAESLGNRTRTKATGCRIVQILSSSAKCPLLMWHTSMRKQGRLGMCGTKRLALKDGEILKCLSNIAAEFE